MSKGRTIHLADPRRPGFCLCGEEAHASTTTDAPRNADCYYCKLQWEREQERPGGLGYMQGRGAS